MWSCVNGWSSWFVTFLLTVDIMEMILKPEGVKPTDFEVAVANEIAEIAKKTKDLAEPLKTFKMTAAKEVEVEGDKKAIIVFVPYKLFKAFRMIQTRLTTELEKKFEGRPVVFIAQRTSFMSKQSTSSSTRNTFFSSLKAENARSAA